MDYDLEKEIDEVGRTAVFQRARDLGWRDDTPPAWVWRGIVAQLRDEALGPIPAVQNTI